MDKSDRENATILVVDDEEHIRLGYSEVLRLDGYNVDIAKDAIIAVEKIMMKPYDMIITDLNMPELGGIQFLKEARKFAPDAKIIIITAFGDYKTYKESLKLSVDTYLNKPIRGAELRSAVKDLLS